MKIATALLALLTASNVMAAWPQFGRDPAHTGTAPVTGQPFRVVLAQIVMDPFAQSSVGSLLTHYGVPIIDGANVYVEVKSGTFSGNWQTLTWNVQAFRWNGPTLQARWITSSDWKPVPQGIGGNGPLFEPLFQPIMANGSIYMPGFGGSIFRVDPGSGEILERLGIPAPFDPDTYVTGPLVADATGIVYYNAIAFRPGQPWLSDVRDAWLVPLHDADDRSTGADRVLSRRVQHFRAPMASCAERDPTEHSVRFAAAGDQRRTGHRRRRNHLHSESRSLQQPLGLHRGHQPGSLAEVEHVAARSVQRWMRRVAPAERDARRLQARGDDRRRSVRQHGRRGTGDR
ncbi:MAG: hypothetical protein DMF57_03320 [Acidobacteria bacterium]|nr:MAG: hypothetical protein DMF57_03320 [Acidobacteriota bacterium]